MLRQRMDLADKVMARIERHHANKDDEITFEGGCGREGRHVPRGLACGKGGAWAGC